MSFLTKIRNVVQNEGARGIRQVLQKEGTKRFAQDLSSKIVQESFQFCETRRYGLPALVSAIAVDPVQGLLATGTYKGVIAVTGAFETPCYLELEEGIAIKSMTFQPGFPVLVVLDAKNAITVFDLIKQQRLFVRNARNVVTCMELLPGSNWLFHGLKDGTIDVFDVYRGQAVPYRIPNILPEGPARNSMVVSIQAHPRDNNQLLIAYNTGVILWNLQQKSPVRRFIYEIPPGAVGGFSADEIAAQQPRFPHVTVISWRPDGLGFVSGYDDGCFVFWDIKHERPILARTIHETQVNVPGARSLSLSSGTTQFVPIYQLVWCLHQNQQDSTLIVAGGSNEADLFGLHLFEFGPKPDMRNPPRRQLTLPMDSDIMDFVVLPRDSPWFNGAYDSIAIIALTSRGGLKSYGYEAPYPLLRSPSCLQWLEPKVTLTKMIGSLPQPLYHRLIYGSDTMNAQRYYDKRLPLRGGVPFPLDEVRLSKDILITVHADCSVRFWDGARLLPLEHLNADLGTLFHKNQTQITAIEFSPSQRAFACGFANGQWVYCQIEDVEAIARWDSFHNRQNSGSPSSAQASTRISPHGTPSSHGSMPAHVGPEELQLDSHPDTKEAPAAIQIHGQPLAPNEQEPSMGTPEQSVTTTDAPHAVSSPHDISSPTELTATEEALRLPTSDPAQSGVFMTDELKASLESTDREPTPPLPPRPLLQEVSLPRPTESQAIFKSSVHLGRINLIAMSSCGLVAVVDEFYTISITDANTRRVLHIEDLKVVTWTESTIPNNEDASSGQSAPTPSHPQEPNLVEQQLVGVQITSLRFVFSTTSEQDKTPGLLLVAGSKEGLFIIFSISSPSVHAVGDHHPLPMGAQSPSSTIRTVRKVESFQIKEKARSVHCAMINVFAPDEGEGEHTPQQQSQQPQQPYQQSATTSDQHSTSTSPQPPSKDNAQCPPSDLVPPGRQSLSLSDTASVVTQSTASSATSRKTTSTSNTLMSSIKEAQDKVKTKAQERLAYFVCVTERGVRLHMNCTSRRIHKVEVPPGLDDPVTAMLYQQLHGNPSSPSSSSSLSPPSYQPRIVAAGVISHEGSTAILCVGDLGQLYVYSVPKLELISPKHLRLPIVTNEGRERLSETVILGDGRMLVPILRFEYRVYSLFGDDRIRISAAGDPISSYNHQDQAGPVSRQYYRQQEPVKFVEVYDHSIKIPPRPAPLQAKTGWFGLGSSGDDAPSQEDLDELLGGEHYRAENPMLKRAGVKGAPGTRPAEDHSTSGVAGMMNQTIQALGERGERLDQLGDKTAQMSAASEDFLKAVRELNAKNANKKWYEF
ncbi:hypothetical protein BGW42_002715 [Actinomortierella wolfii]|nr:hypothetical protein BGW42_002715 [Actinomortierella wolfii]